MEFNGINIFGAVEGHVEIPFCRRIIRTIIRRHFSVQNGDDVEQFHVRNRLIADKLIQTLDIDGVLAN